MGKFGKAVGMALALIVLTLVSLSIFTIYMLSLSGSISGLRRYAENSPYGFKVYGGWGVTSDRGSLSFYRNATGVYLAKQIAFYKLFVTLKTKGVGEGEVWLYGRL